MRGDLEAGAQLGELLEHLQPLLRVTRHRPARRHQQVRIGPLAAAADPAADLVELREPEVIGAVDQDGVGAGDVQAGLDDGRAEEHVVLAVDEVGHHLFQLALLHLAVRHGDLRLRHELRQVVVDAADRLDPVVQEEDLPAARQLPFDRLLDGGAVELADEGADRAAVHRRRADDGEVAHAHHGHVQGARDGGRREGDHVDQLAQLLQLLLVLDPETLLLVDHHQPQILERHVLREQPVGADQHVDLALARARKDLLRLLGGLEAADHLDRDRIVGEPLAERVVVLRGEHGGGDQHRDLLLVLDGLEGGPQRDLGLSVSDVAANQPVHRARLLHVREHVLDGLRLVGRLVELEVGLERPVHAVRRAEGIPLVRRARRVDVEQLGGHLEQLLLHPRLALEESLALEGVEPGLRRVAADVLLDLAQPVDRQVQAVLAGKLEQDEVGGEAAHLEAGQTVVACDAMLDVHHQIAFLQIAKIGRLLAEGAGPAGGSSGPRAGAEDVLVGIEGESVVLVDEPRGDLAGEQVRVDRGIEERGRLGRQLGHDARHQLAVEQQPARALGLGRRMARDQRGDAAISEVRQPADERRQRSVFPMVPGDLGAQLRGRPEREVDLRDARRGIGGEPEPSQLQHGGVVEHRPHVALVQVVLLGRQGELALLARGGERGRKPGPQISPLALQLERIVEHPQRLGRQVVGHRFQPPRIEAGQDGRQAGCEERVILRVALQLVDQLAQPPGRRLHRIGGRTDGRDGGLATRVVEHDLARGGHRHLGELPHRALRLRVERAQALDGVTEELDADGLRVERRPEVEDTAADREGTGILDQRDLRVPRRRELCRQLVPILGGGDRELERARIERLPRQHPAGEPAHREHDHARVAEVEVEEARQPRHRRLRVWREPLVGQHLVAGQADDGGIRVGLRPEEAQVALESLGGLFVGFHADEGTLQRTGEMGQRVTARGAMQAGRAGAPAGPERGEELGKRGRAPRARCQRGLQGLHRRRRGVGPEACQVKRSSPSGPCPTGFPPSGPAP